jgi:hypothetical protein
VLDGAAGLLGGPALRGVLRLEYGDLLEAHGFSYMFAAVGLTAICKMLVSLVGNGLRYSREVSVSA